MNIKRIIQLESLAGQLSAWTMEWSDCPDGANDALRGLADAINGIASLLRDKLELEQENEDQTNAPA